MPAGKMSYYGPRDALRTGRQNRAAKRAKNTKGFMKKTTKKGAYKKARKNQMVKRRAPMVETKRRVHSIINGFNNNFDGTPSSEYQDTVGGLSIPNNDAFTLLDLASFYRNSHGFNEYNMLGDALFSKYLKLKVQIRWPEGTNMIVNPVKLYLITGWVTQPTGYTLNTTPTEQGATKEDLLIHLTAQLKEYFDERRDFLRFREKSESNIRIDKWQSLQPDLRHAVAAVPGQVTFPEDATKPDGTQIIRTTGAVPFVKRSYTWKIMRKIHYSQGTATATGTTPPAGVNQDTQNLYPNNQWLPFALIYNPEYARMLNSENAPVNAIVAFNDVHYYTDS